LKKYRRLWNDPSAKDMTTLTSEQKSHYFQRSFTAVDGLWFVKTEEFRGFDHALETDREVWKVMPKIQARLLKEMLQVSEGMAALQSCLEAKLEAEGYGFEIGFQDAGRCLALKISRCPWHDAMIKAGREKLSGKVGRIICQAEYQTWASEFGKDIDFSMDPLLCEGNPCCTFRFSK
jgi:hypothetical protein